MARTCCWGGDGAGRGTLGPLFASKSPPIQFKKALQAVPIHENSEWYHMLLSMSKQFFAAQMFTYSTLNEKCIWPFPSFEDISQLFFLHATGDFPLSSPAMDGFPVCPFQLGFYGRHWWHLERIRMPGLAKVSLRLVRKRPTCNQVYLSDVSPISPSTQIPGGVR